MLHNTWIYILLMALVTYLIRMLPLTLLRKEVENKTVKSFLYYVPYVTLAVMTFPAIIHATRNIYSGIAGLAVAVMLSWRKMSLPVVALISCITVYVIELFIV